MKEEIQTLTNVANSNIKQDLRDLASDIIYGLLVEMYNVSDEEEEEDYYEDQPTSQYTDTISNKVTSATYTISDLHDLIDSLNR